jgi:hypothetical protein
MNDADKLIKHNERVARLLFSTVYPLYLAKVEKKGRTEAELLAVIEWLTGFNHEKVLNLIQENTSFEAFFQQATLHPNAHLITGLICGVRIETIENTLTQHVRYLDKLVDELSKGKTLEKILRK